MLFRETKLAGAFVIEPERFEDERGFFARTWDVDEFTRRGLNPSFVQCSVSFNRCRDTLRGMHYQIAPDAETKLVRCTKGAIFDVLVDLRAGSPTLGCWVTETLTQDNHYMFYIPEGIAHGFQTLTDGVEVFYQISARYQPGSARGVRWDDPAFGIQWPNPIGAERIIATKDRAFEDWNP